MKFFTKKRKLIFIFIILLFLFVPLFAIQAIELTNPSSKLEFKPQVTIPGSDSFIKGKVKELAPGDTSLMIQYIVAIYKFFVGIAGIIAVFMIVFGGVLWLFSGGSSERISKAKEIIIGSITGLLLAVGSYMILYTINPNLTKFTLSISALNPDSFPAVGSQEAKVCNYKKFIDAGAKEEYLQCGLQFKETSNSKLQSEINCLFAHCEDADDVCTNDFIIPLCRGRINGQEYFKKGIGITTVKFKDGEPLTVDLSQQSYQVWDNYSVNQCGYIYIVQGVYIPSSQSYDYEYYLGSDCEGDGLDSYCFLDKNIKVTSINITKGPYLVGWLGYHAFAVTFNSAKCYAAKCEQVANSSAGCSGLQPIGTNLVQPSGGVILAMQPPAQQQIVGLAQAKEANKATYGNNEKIYVTSMFRSVAYQGYNYCENPDGWEPPGQSTHELGIAFDINYAASGITTASQFNAFNQLAEQHSFKRSTCFQNGQALATCTLGAGESWHFTYQGTYNNIRTGQGGICP